MWRRTFSANIFIALAYRILIVMILFSLCRIGFFVFNHKMFPDVPFDQLITILKGGVVFDISAVVYINSLFIVLLVIPFDIRYNELYQKIVKYSFFCYEHGWP